MKRKGYHLSLARIRNKVLLVVDDFDDKGMDLQLEMNCVKAVELGESLVALGREVAMPPVEKEAPDGRDDER